MNETERKLFSEFLDDAGERFASMCCNEYTLPDTEEGRAIAKDVADWFNHENQSDEVTEPALDTYNWAVFSVLRKKAGF